MSKRIPNCRYLCSEITPIEFVDDRGTLRVISANLEEIETRRLGFVVERPIVPGTKVSVQSHGHTLKGKVTRSLRQPALGWILDVKLSPGCRWSDSLFLPEHPLPISIH